DHCPRGSPHLSASGEHRPARDRVCHRSRHGQPLVLAPRDPPLFGRVGLSLGDDNPLMLGGSRLWRHADFVKLWAGQTISVVGSQVTTLALPTIAILLLHATAGQVGLLASLERAAFPVLALFVGVWIDRVRRRPLMIAADALRAAALLSIPLVAAIGTLTLLQLYAVATILGVGTVIFDIGYLAYVPTLVGRPDLLEANTKLEVSHSGSYLTGPALAGGLIQLVGAAQAILADALSFLVS